ncbi:MAG: large subunit ribosomal protein L12 [Haloarculaceae archaeon]|jgi:large subunit ribosomal protein L12
MEYVYAALILNETGEEINEENLTNVLDAAGVDVEESRVKALVAALEDVDIDEAVEEAAAVPATTGGGAAPATGGEEEVEEEEVEEEEEEAVEEEGGDGGDDDEDDGDAGEGLGELFG